ncbi:protein FAM135B-like isoform X1 [Glycine soja]|uniref:protein FAM135B-like isoform X1 n=2 Tax=Glycine soja TaxID=3848 RepID=UPI00103E78BD|nr:protein FAM135B-like isoform X1 [Glycine soja]XP_028228302.1 protein FAM135B-like isoform X1 [Glycine soja]XP_028228303.1 protein FAM135B-like isoform X1 [Glycine soja]XP_028228304.1 protein FAM135B-like isoform X1 [Glycine soja]
MPRTAKVKSVATLETVQEIGVYIHRFHNLDLFKQGWYRIKITVRWEDSESLSFGIPASVVQYEAPDLDPSSVYGVWRIDDTDNSFSTQSFRIKYARQDVHLYMMIVFNLSRSEFVDLATTAVILKFELIYAPATEDGVNMQASLDDSSAAIHEFRIPPKALIGLHSYCPVHFDALHAVLVDVSVHVTLLKAVSYSSALKFPSNSANSEVIIDKSSVSKKNIDKSCDTLNQGFGGVAFLDTGNVSLVKALLTSRDILVEELQKISKAINEALDISEFVSIMSNMKLLNSVLQVNQFAIDVEVVGQGKPQNGLKGGNEALDFLDVEKLHSLSQNELLECFHSLGDQLIYLWKIFLKFHRDNKSRILGFLRDAWVKDRKAEWSIWMLYSKVEMPHHYINSKSEESSHRGVHRRVSSLWKLPDDPLQTAATRAELHRRSIEQMRINNRSVQDMQIFGDLLHTPIVIVEHVMNVPRRCPSANSLLRHIGCIDSDGLPIGLSSDTIGKKFATQSNARVLRIVVFVHGFQGHHLDLRLVRNQWLLIDPKVEFLMSEANEDKTFGDFREMGHRLAKEVIAFLKSKMDKASRYGSLGDIRLSFVGHSIGNLIIRTAIADSIMEPFLCHLHTYVSVSGPHLGYLYSSNSLFNSGLWFLKKLKGTQCIHQLTFTDDPDFQNTFLYKLCKQKTLEHFRNIILLSSPQDGYVPYHSARIESCQAASRDTSKKGKLFLEMLNACLDQIRANSMQHRVFMRCDVNFDASTQGKNLDSIIGRAAHIEFLDSDIFARFIMWSFPDLFR